jgi:hypothetical protein
VGVRDVRGGGDAGQPRAHAQAAERAVLEAERAAVAHGLGGGDREPQPGPRTLRVPAAGEALEHQLALLRRDPGAVVVDQQLGAAPVGRRDRHDDRSVRAPVACGVLEQVVEQHPQALGLTPQQRPGGRRLEPRVDPRMSRARTDHRAVGQLAEVDVLGPRRRPGLTAGELLQLLHEGGEPVGVALGRTGRAGREVRVQARERRAQLVPRVGGEPPGAGQRRLATGGGRGEALEHRVHVAGERVDLLGPVAGGDAHREIGRLGDLARRLAQALDRAQREARERARDERRGEQGPDQRGEDDQPQPRLALLERLEARRRLQQTAARQRAHDGAPVLTGGAHRLRAPEPLGHREAVRNGRPAADHRAVREHDAGETIVARVGQPTVAAPVAVAIAEPRRRPEGRVAQLGSRTLGEPLEILVERAAVGLAADDDHRQARDEQRRADRRHRGERHAPGERARREAASHPRSPSGSRSTKPTPRTVWIIRASPSASSLRRR